MNKCNHEERITTDIGFVMCKKCEKILDVPTLLDLAYAEQKGWL